MREKTLHTMKLHETITLGNYEILRVPGGFIYTTFNSEGNISSCFVPYSNEFKENKPF